MLVREKYVDRTPLSMNNSRRKYPSKKPDLNSIFYLVRIKDKEKLTHFIESEDQKLDPLSMDANGETPLIISCRSKKWINAFTLLDYYGEEAGPNLLSNEGYPPIYYSIASTNLVDRLLTYKSVLDNIGMIFNCGNNILTSLLLKESFINADHVIDHMNLEYLNHVTNDGETALILAAKNGQHQLCRKLINKGVCLSFYDSNGMSALDYLIQDVKLNPEKEKIDICFSIIDKEHDNYTNDLKLYTHDDFKSFTEINISHQNNYGKIMWCIEKSTGRHKIIKMYNAYKTSKLIPQDLIKELIYIRELNIHTEGIVSFDGFYTDNDDNIHLIFEPLCVTLDVYFLLLSLYQDTPELSLMKKMRIERIYNNLETTITSIHEHGILHSDIKSTNIMIGYGGKIKLLDFGISDFIGFSPYFSNITNYISSTSIKAPDNGNEMTVNILEEITNTKKSRKFKAIRSFVFDSSRKSYSSDIYSFAVTMIQMILKNQDRFVSIENNIYKIIKLENDDIELNIIKISDIYSDKLKEFSFYHKLTSMINIDANYRFSRKVNCKINPVNTVKSSNPLINRFIHYSVDELKNQKYEMFYAEKIFNNYKDCSILMNPGSQSTKCLEIFSRINRLLNGKISIDTYYNALYNSVNYQGNENIIVICLSYLYIYSYIFNWKAPNIEKLAEEFKIEQFILIGNINSIIISLLPSVPIIPFFLLVQRIIILMQMIHMDPNDINITENNIFDKLLLFLSGNKDKVISRPVYIWDFIQCFVFYSNSCLPFEVDYQSDSILELFNKF